MNKPNCTADVHNDFGVSFHQCVRKGSLFEGGKHWCKTHAPSTIKARAEAQDASWKARQEGYDASRMVEKAKEAVVLAAEAFVACKAAGNADSGQLEEAVRLLGVAEARFNNPLGR